MVLTRAQTHAKRTTLPLLELPGETRNAIYRLFLSPLARAKIPGPPLGAFSKFYEAYYEVVKQGKLAFKLDELHERYGPIVRITPEEIHLRDSAFLDQLYVKHPRASRYSSTASRFGNDDSMFAVADAGLHRMLRAPLNPLYAFSTPDACASCLLIPLLTCAQFLPASDSGAAGSRAREMRGPCRWHRGA